MNGKMDDTYEARADLSSIIGASIVYVCECIELYVCVYVKYD